jgi:hypothetical protein
MQTLHASLAVTCCIIPMMEKISDAVSIQTWEVGRLLSVIVSQLISRYGCWTS